MRVEANQQPPTRGAVQRSAAPPAQGIERARLQLLQRHVGNRTLARFLDKGFWIVEPDGSYTWHKGTDATGFVASGLPNYKSKDSWFAWPVYRRQAAAPTVAERVETPVVEPGAESPPTSGTSVVDEADTSGEPTVTEEAEAAVVEPPEETVVAPAPEPVVPPQPVVVPQATAAPQPQPVPQDAPTPQPVPRRWRCRSATGP